MFNRGLPLFNLFGFQVRVDPSWFLLAFLITWTLGFGFFPYVHPGLSISMYLSMGLLVAVGLFFSIVVHEFAHAWVARRYGLPMGGITLFLFGGVAEMEHEAPSPKVEFLMALAGPLTSVLVLFLFMNVTFLGAAAGWPLQVIGVTSYLATMNGILILFNMVPAFPLDGGRILRSILWQWKKNLKWATRVTSRIGVGFGVLLMALGFLRIISGGFISGLWFILVGWFLKNAANMAYRQLLMRREFEGEPVSHFMQQNPIVVPAGLSLQNLADQYFYQHYHKKYPVVENGSLIGSVNLDEINRYPREEWTQHSVREIMAPSSPENTIQAEMDAIKALSMLNQTGSSQLMVVHNNRLVGILNLRDLLKLLSRKMELEEGAY